MEKICQHVYSIFGVVVEMSSTSLQNRYPAILKAFRGIIFTAKSNFFQLFYLDG